MKLCHVCSKECEDSAELCPVCGAVLRDISEGNEKPNEILNPVLAVTVEDVVSAEIFSDILKDNNISFYCDGEDVMQVTFGGSFISQDFYVNEEDLDKAQELYKELLASEENVEFLEDFDEEI